MNQEILSQFRLLVCWADIARSRGMKQADFEMSENFNGWKVDDAIATVKALDEARQE